MRNISAICCLLAAIGAQQLVAQTTAESLRPEPAAASLALDLIGEPDGEPLIGAELDQRTEEVGSLLRCPVCQGLSVADSPTTSALAMREEARDLLRLGYSEDQVLAYFERSYGEFIRLSPKPEGFNLVVWFLPVIGLLVGALVIGSRMLRRRPSTGSEADQAKNSGTDEAGDSGDPSAKIPSDLAAYAERVRREVGE